MAKVAVIDDDLAVSQLYELKLKKAGYKVRTAANGQEGLTVLEQFHPDIVLLDLRMPVMEGLEMLKMLRAQHWAKHIPVIILSNVSKEEAPSELHHLGVHQYLVKAHHTPQQVVDIVTQTLHHYKKTS